MKWTLFPSVVAVGKWLHSSDSPAVGYFPHRRNLQARETRHLQVAPLYGSINDYAYYFVDIHVGNPPQRQSVILDSGSSLLGFPCSDCGRSCGSHLDMPFDISKSSSAKTYGCADKRCFSRESCYSSEPNTCRYSQVYSEGSSIEGFFFSDLIALGTDSVVYDYIGCHTRETVLFTTQQASGILGVSFPKGGRQPTVMDVLMGSPVVNSKVFALCAAEHGGSLSVGGYNASFHKESYSSPGNNQLLGNWFSNLLRGSAARQDNQRRRNKDIVWAKINSDSSYSIQLSRLYFAQKLVVNQGFGETLVDSGTTYTYFPNDIFNKIAATLQETCTANNLLPESKSAGTCVKGRSDLVCFNFKGTLPVTEYLKRIPSFTLELGNGGSIEWGPESWLFQKTERVWCSAIENNRRAQTILGMSFMKMKQVIFDRDNSYIGFVSADCPIRHVRDRPQEDKVSLQIPSFVGLEEPVAIEMNDLAPLAESDKNVSSTWAWKRNEDLPYFTSMQSIVESETHIHQRLSSGGWMMAGGFGVSVVGGLVAMVIRSNLRTEISRDENLSREEYDHLTPIISTVRAEATTTNA